MTFGQDYMGDTDGSSDAALGAQSELDTSTDDEPSARSGGFLSRVIGALSPSESDSSDAPEPTLAERPVTHGMINLRRMRVDDVAIPKAEITAVPITSTMDELVAVFKESGLTRLPVYDGTLDTPVGLAHLKDLALTHGFNGNAPDFDLRAMLRPLLFVPPSMTIGVLLTKMQAERRHMALVIDEYGGTDGLVSLEDLVETVDLKPTLLRLLDLSLPENLAGRSLWPILIGGLGVTLIIAGAVSFFASSNPDGLEYVAEQEGFIDASNVMFVHKGATVRLGYSTNSKGEKVRVARPSGDEV